MHLERGGTTSSKRSLSRPRGGSHRARETPLAGGEPDGARAAGTADRRTATGRSRTRPARSQIRLYTYLFVSQLAPVDTGAVTRWSAAATFARSARRGPMVPRTAPPCLPPRPAKPLHKQNPFSAPNEPPMDATTSGGDGGVLPLNLSGSVFSLVSPDLATIIPRVANFPIFWRPGLGSFYSGRHRGEAEVVGLRPPRRRGTTDIRSRDGRGCSRQGNMRSRLCTCSSWEEVWV